MFRTLISWQETLDWLYPSNKKINIHRLSLLGLSLNRQQNLTGAVYIGKCSPPGGRGGVANISWCHFGKIWTIEEVEGKNIKEQGKKMKIKKKLKLKGWNICKKGKLKYKQCAWGVNIYMLWEATKLSLSDGSMGFWFWTCMKTPENGPALSYWTGSLLGEAVTSCKNTWSCGGAVRASNNSYRISSRYLFK